jgi:capsule polysaccharide export protein KpsC/LpsZ
MILDSLEKQESTLCSEIFALSLSNWKIVEICEYFNLSRFKVKKHLDKAERISKKICMKEGFYGKDKKISGSEEKE